VRSVTGVAGPSEFFTAAELRERYHRACGSSGKSNSIIFPSQSALASASSGAAYRGGLVGVPAQANQGA
jgi:hypothetical protein